ncbi:MAG: DUF5829 family protein [Cyanobacteria bacterium P01_G01_bin.54]
MKVGQNPGATERVEPPIEFNHLYITLAPETIESIVKSAFISHTFSIVRQTVKADDSSWTGTYLRGKRTYLEFFAPGGAADVREGYAGMGFSTQRLGQIDQIEETLKSRITENRLSRHLRCRQTEQGEVPWFHTLSIVPLETQHFMAWLMDFHEDYLKTENIKMTTAGHFEREAYMAACGVSGSLLNDILEVHLELSTEEHAVLDQLLGTLGFQTSCVGNTTRYCSAAFTLCVSSVSAPDYRIRQVICSMTTTASQAQAYVFGDDARLTVDSTSMVWSFGPATDFDS